MKKKEIPAIFKEDLQSILDSVGELTPILNGERFCMICNQTIDLDSIQVIIPLNGKIKDYVCYRSNCVLEFNNK